MQKNKVIKIFDSMLFPENIKCIICDRELDEDSKENICNKCSPIKNTSFCLICGRSLFNEAHPDDFEVVAITASVLGFGFSDHWIRIPHQKNQIQDYMDYIDYETDFENEVGIEGIKQYSVDSLQDDNEQENIIDICNNCTKFSPSFHRARSSFVYKNEITGLVYRFKYGNNKWLGKHFALSMYDTFNKYLKDEFEIDFVSFVPMAKSRQKKRGYNQAEILARELGDMMNKDVVPLFDRAEAPKEKRNAAKLTKRERQEYIRGSINLRVDIDGGLLKNKVVLLVDDVLTTGTTINECAKKIIQKANTKIIVLTLAAALA